MNEILQQRIESVQAGKNITHAQIEAKRSLREQLERDVENFLAGGGETQVLPIGFTHFKDGVIPQSKAQVISDKERLDREKAIELKNQAIREYKLAVKEQKKQQDEAQIQDQIAVMSKFESNLQNKSDFKRLAAMAGYHPQYLKDAAKGRTKLNTAKWDQIKKLVKSFEYSEKRIAKAIKKPTKSPKRKAPSAPSVESLRLKRLVEAKSEAIKNGEKSFIAECKKCGPAKFILQARGKVFCYPCHLAHVERLKQKRMTKEQVSTLEQKRKRFTYNSELAEQTKLQGLRYFNGLCEKCGLTEFRIVGGGRKYHCVHCSKASAQKYKKWKRENTGATA
ncbi:MAG: hypothetical protein RSA22_05810 [Acinetobacter sp.]